MQTLLVDHVAKSFASTQAVRDVSFAVERGEIFALLGPNGAGKTTTIRMVLDIIRPDSGSIAVLGGPTSDAVRDRIGYLPEDRGLYRGMKLLDCLVFLGGLKGLRSAEAKRRALAFLDRFELAEHSQKKVSELSRGMQQKAQLIAALQHAPDLVIVDEPFAGLDPVNVRLIKDVLREQAAAGTTIILSAHEMQLVQELAGRMVMLHRGEVVLYGQIADVRRSFAPNAVLVEGQGSLAALPGVASVQATANGALLQLDSGASPQAVLRALSASSFVV
ncbi:MAG: ATP-binding cassette domain-containing protein, partial [Chloroflexales bacterium]|nr:ATP-binding cassette domain-containing protein [Chloroflexales bacterium]